MNKFYGAIGYAVTKEISPGVYEDSIVTHNYYGEIVRNSRQLPSKQINCQVRQLAPKHLPELIKRQLLRYRVIR